MSDSNFERRSNDVQIGYLTGRIEAIEERLDEHMEAEEKAQQMIAEQLAKITEQLSMYRHFTFFIKTLLLCASAIMAWNFTEAKALWHTFIYGGPH